MQEQVNTAAKKAGQAASKAVRHVKDKTEDTVTATDASEFTLDGLFANFKSMIAGFDESPLAFIKENPLRAALGGFFIGLIFGAAMSKRSVTK